MARPALRYALITVHVILWILLFVFSFTNTNSLLLILFTSLAGLALVIYIPATLVLSLRNSSKKFNIALVEIVYLTFQNAFFLAGMVTAAQHRATVYHCVNGRRYGYEMRHCDSLVVFAVFAAIQVIVTTAWQVWIIRLVLSAPCSNADAYKTPTHKLVAGEHSEFGYGLGQRLNEPAKSTATSLAPSSSNV